MQRSIVAEDKTVQEHAAALQGLANDKMMAYAETLRRVQCEGSRNPHQPSQVSRKAPVRSGGDVPGHIVSDVVCGPDAMPTLLGHSRCCWPGACC